MIDWRVYFFSNFFSSMNMNENQSIIKYYILIVKTVHGNPDEDITVRVKGTQGQTENISLGKSQVERIVRID
jgi:hypothetical protein